jgi:hypothetical protein
MPGPAKLQKAKMSVIEFQQGGQEPKVVNPSLEVQFNPESLKLSYSNSLPGGDQSGGSAIQFASQSTTKLSFDLWFDVSAPLPARVGPQGVPDVAAVKDVRKLTGYVVRFMRPAPPADKNKKTGGAVPAVRFEWGAFQFDGIVESLSETIDFFSPEGHALRSQLSVSMTQQEIPAELLRGADPGAGPSPGLDFQLPIKLGDTLQGVADALGQLDDWQDLANINDIENPRDLAAGTLLNLGL